MLVKEYRICMPLSVDEYRVGQLYMIAKHSLEQSDKGEGVEVVKNEECSDSVHGRGRYTEKRIHLSSRLPGWISSLIPKVFYITEKAWNYFPYTVTEYTCSFLPRFSIYIETRYEDNAGTSENCMNLCPEELEKREVDFVDIAYDQLPPRLYKESEDLTIFKSVKTERGPLAKNWKEVTVPLMCSYKVVKVKFEVLGLQGKVETFAHRSVRDIFLLGHRQAFAWIDEWITGLQGMTKRKDLDLLRARKFATIVRDKTSDMSMDDLREYEANTNEETNKKVLQS